MDKEKAKGILFGLSSAREEVVISKLPGSLLSQILSFLKFVAKPVVNFVRGISMEEKKDKEIFFGFSSARRDEDMISKLPDALITQILSYLTTKEAVTTSVLSNRWRNLWLSIPGLDLNSYEFPYYNAFASFIDRFLDFYREEKSCLHKLRLSILKNEDDRRCVMRWIDFVAKTRKLKHLDVECFVKHKFLEVIPVSLFLCETLLYLRLRQVLIGSSFEDSSFVSLPCLKTMRLERNVYANERSLESLISSCPVLEDLSIARREDDNVKVLRVCSQTLTSLSIKYDKVAYEEVLADDFEYGELEVLIDAPKLKYLKFVDELSPSKTITNSGSLTKVNILGDFYLEESADQVRKFFTSLAGVKDLKIPSSFFWYIEMVPLLQFCNLSCLEAKLILYYLETVPTLLASCPNLRTLILDINDSEEGEQMRVSHVPLCLLSSLEFVEIKCNFIKDPTRRNAIVELLRYFAENSVILEKLVLRLEKENRVGFIDLFAAMPRRSSKCQIIVC